MSALNNFPSFITFDTPTLCGRRGCGKPVANGMACDGCSNWFHANCTGLSSDQYESMNNQGCGYRCMSCIYLDNSHHRASAVVSPHSVKTEDWERLVDSVADLSKKIEALGIDMNDRFSQLRDTVYKVGSSISEKQFSLDAAVDRVACALPERAAADKVVKLSNQAIREAAEELKEKSLRSCRIILWGNFPPSADPSNIATSVFKAILPDDDPSTVRACWLRAKQIK